MLISELLVDVRNILRDDFSYGDKSFSDAEMLLYCNRAMDICADLSAACNPITKAVPLVAGVTQAIPANGGRILGFSHNDLPAAKVKVGPVSYSGKSAVRDIDLDSLNAQLPGWPAAKASPLVVFVMFDPVASKQFQVYPPNDGNGMLVVRYTQRPAHVTTVTEEFPLPNEFREPVINLIMYHALARDGEDTENSKRSSDFFQMASMLLQGADSLKLTLSSRSTMRK